MRRLQKFGVAPRTIIDIGANLGQFSTAASHILEPERLIVIEANPNLEAVLYKNLAHVVNKEILITGVGNFNGDLPFNFNSDSQVSSFLGLGSDRVESFPKSVTLDICNVPIQKLDSLSNQIDMDQPILLKIDVQGFEKEVIEGAGKFLASVEWVLIETSFAKLYDGEPTFTEMIDLMKGCGFDFLGPVNFHENPDRTSIIEMDALFVRLKA